MGNPSNATEECNADNYLMAKPYFALSYNNSKGTPNWVSWHLTYERTWVGEASALLSRSRIAKQDSTKSFRRITRMPDSTEATCARTVIGTEPRR